MVSILRGLHSITPCVTPWTRHTACGWLCIGTCPRCGKGARGGTVRCATVATPTRKPVGTPRSSDQPHDGRPAAGAQGPTVLRIMLGTQLRRLREVSGVTAEAAGRAIREI